MSIEVAINCWFLDCWNTHFLCTIFSSVFLRTVAVVVDYISAFLNAVTSIGTRVLNTWIVKRACDATVTELITFTTRNITLLKFGLKFDLNRFLTCKIHGY